MSEQTTQNPEPEISEEEAQKQLAEAQSHLNRQIGKAKQAFSQNIKYAEDRLNFAAGKLAETEALRDQVAEHKDHPEGQYHLTNLELLCRVYGNMKTMMEIEKAANVHNMALVESEEVPENPQFAVPAQNVTYLEARSKLDYHLGMFSWVANLEGIDVVLRATVNQPAIVCQAPEEEAFRQGNVAELKAAVAADRDLAMYVGQLGSELQETQALLEWAASSFTTILQLPNEAKKGYLEDADWAKLNAKVAYLGDIAPKAQQFPVLAKHFPHEEPAPLPYDAINWSDSGNTGRLSGQTGRLSGQTGRLSQSQGQSGRLRQ